MSRHKLLFLISFFMLLMWRLSGEEEKFLALILAQEKLYQELKTLEEKFIRLSDVLKESEPENAKLLLAAFQKSKEFLVDSKMDISAKNLKEKDLEKSIVVQKEILQNLRQVLDTLTNLDLSNKNEVDRLEKLKKELDTVIRNEKMIQKESVKLNDKQGAVDQLNLDVQKLEQLIKDSEETLQSTINERVQSLKSVSDIAKRLEQQHKMVSAIYGSMVEQPQDKASSDVQDLIPTTPPSLGSEEEQQPSAQNLKKAEQQFKAAEKQMIESNPFQSEENQKVAIAALKDALKDLAKEKDRILNLPDTYHEELAKRQNQVLGKLQELRQKQNGKQQIGQDSPKAQPSSGGEESHQPSSDAPQDAAADNPSDERGGESQTPEKRINKAEKYMYEAEKMLQEKKVVKAQELQQKSIAELEQIKKEIEQELEQLRKEEREEKLAGLENRFSEILQRERTIQDQAAALHERQVKKQWSRLETIKSQGLSQDQQALHELVARVEDILLEDATAVIFPSMIQDLKDNMSVLVMNFQKEDLGNMTLAFIQDVVQSLEEMVDALKKAKEDAKKDKESSQGEQGDGEGNSRLISKSAELKLLRQQQLRINQMSKAIAKEMSAQTSGDMKNTINHIYARQKKVLELARKLNETN